VHFSRKTPNLNSHGAFFPIFSVGDNGTTGVEKLPVEGENHPGEHKLGPLRGEERRFTKSSFLVNPQGIKRVVGFSHQK